MTTKQTRSLKSALIMNVVTIAVIAFIFSHIRYNVVSPMTFVQQNNICVVSDNSGGIKPVIVTTGSLVTENAVCFYWQ